MKIKMNYTKTASPDGVQIESYEKDKIYTVGVNITQRTADVFIKNKRAIIYIEPVKPKQVDATEKETKAYFKPSKNKRN